MSTLEATVALHPRRTDGAHLRLRLPATKGNVALARAAISAFAAHVGAGEPLLDDLRAAVGESANNVVVHAYEDVTGPIVIEARVDERAVTVTVSDAGAGMELRELEPRDFHGVGLSVIEAVTQTARVSRGDGGGTIVRMGFRSATPLRPVGAPQLGKLEIQAGEHLDRLILDAGPPLIGPVVGRLASALGARAGLSVERLGEVGMVADALGAHVPPSLAASHVRVTLRATRAGIEVTAGPLQEGGATEVVRASGVAGLPPLLRHLSSAIDAERRDGHEWLRLALLTERAGD